MRLNRTNFNKEGKKEYFTDVFTKLSEQKFGKDTFFTPLINF